MELSEEEKNQIIKTSGKMLDELIKTVNNKFSWICTELFPIHNPGDSFDETIEKMKTQKNWDRKKRGGDIAVLWNGFLPPVFHNLMSGLGLRYSGHDTKIDSLLYLIALRKAMILNEKFKIFIEAIISATKIVSGKDYGEKVERQIFVYKTNIIR
jgi:hypothetical protein